jgi:hypothetical protein
MKITPEALIEMGFADTSFTDEGIDFTEFTYTMGNRKIQVSGDNFVEIQVVDYLWVEVNATTIEDIKDLIRLFK